MKQERSSNFCFKNSRVFQIQKILLIEINVIITIMYQCDHLVFDFMTRVSQIFDIKY